MAPKRSIPQSSLRRSQRLRRLKMGQANPSSEEIEVEEHEDSQNASQEEVSAPDKRKGKEKAEDEKETDEELIKRLRKKYGLHMESSGSSFQPPASRFSPAATDNPSPPLAQIPAANKGKEKEKGRGFYVMEYLVEMTRRMDAQKAPCATPQPPISALTDVLVKITEAFWQSQLQLLEEVGRILKAQMKEFKDVCIELLDSFDSFDGLSASKPNPDPKPDNVSSDSSLS